MYTEPPNKLEGKRFMAYDIVNALKKEGKETFLSSSERALKKKRSNEESSIRYFGYHLTEENVSLKK